MVDTMIGMIKKIKNFNFNLYHIFLFIYIFGGISAVVLSVIYKFNREQIGFAFIIGALVSIFIPKNYQISYSYKVDNPWFFKSSIILWTYIALSSIIIFMNSIQNYYLPLIYFLFISCLSLIIISQILISQNLTKYRIGIILIEIIVLSTILSASFIFLFPGPYGNDSSFHTYFISKILTSGSIEYSTAGQYQIYPIYQILFAETILLPDLHLKIATLVLAFDQILFLLFIFLICNKLFNSKVAMISTLLISISTNILVPRYYFFPGSFSVIFFIFFLYLCLASNLYEFRPVFILTILFFSNFIHPFLSFIIFFSILIMFISSKMIRYKYNFENINIQKNLIYLSAITMLIQWMRQIGDYSLFSNFIRSIKFTSEKGSVVTQATSSPFYNWTDVFMYELGFAILIIFGIGGALWFLKVDSGKGPIKGNRIMAVIVTLIFIPIPYILAIIYPNSLPARWFIFIEVVASIFAGTSIYMIFGTLSRYKLNFLIFIPLFLLSFFSITSPTSNPNTHIYATELSERDSLFQSEISGANFVNGEINKKNIHGNSAFLLFIDKKISTIGNYIDPKVNKTYRTGIVLIREEDIEKGFILPLFGRQGKLLEINRPSNIFINYLNKIDKIYENGKVRIYSNL